MEGGDLGYMTEEEATPEFAKMIRETPTGGISKPFQTDMGWHVAKIDDRRKEQPPAMEELRGPILKHLTMMQIGDVLKELRQEAKIEKQTSPRNSTLDVDPFELPAEPARPPVAAAPPPTEAAAPKPAAEGRERGTPATTPPAATPPPAKSPAAASSTAAPKPTATTPASSNPSPPRPQTQPAATSGQSAPAQRTTPASPPRQAPATTPPAPAGNEQQPSGPVSEGREGGVP